MKTPKPPTELHKKTHQIEKVRNFGWCREKRVRRRERVWEEEGPRKAGEGEVQGRGGPGRRVKEGVHRPAQIGQKVQVSRV